MHSSRRVLRYRSLRVSSLIACSLGVLLFVFLTGCGQESPANDTAAADSSSTKPAKPKKEKAIRVNVGEVRQTDLVLPVFADGAIRTPKTVSVNTKVGGELREVLVRDGDHVTQGQVIARIDRREYEISLQESRYRHLQALSQMAAEADTFSVNEEALANFRRRRDELESMVARGTLTRPEYEATILKLEMSSLQAGAFRDAVFQQRTGLAEARMAEERANLNLEYTAVRAPFEGIVHGLSVVAGEILTVNTTVCTLFNNEHLEARLNVLEADLGHLSEGRPVLLSIPATGDTLRAAIDVISPTLDPGTRTCEVVVRFDNPTGRFRPGMFVRARIAGIIYHDRLLVPKSALLIRDNRPLVFKQEGDRARWLYVDTGLQNDDWVEILKVHSGGTLVPGDLVVVSNHLTLAHEAKIKVRKQIEPADRWHLAESNGQ